MVAISERLATATTLHTAITEAVLRKRAADYALAILLRRCDTEGLHRELGYISVADYGEQAHGLGRAKTRALVNLAGTMDAVPAMADAVRNGVLSWTKAREVARVVTNDNADEWVSFAKNSTNRDLEALARTGFAGDSVTKAKERLADADPLHRFVITNLSADQWRLIEDALERVRQASGLSREAFSRGDALVTIMQRYLAGLDGDDISAPPSSVRYQRVVHVCTGCGQAEGETGRPDDTDVLMSDCDTEEVDLRTHGTRVRGTRRKAIPPRVRTAVLHRDRHQCRVPDCTNRLWLDVHHIIPRSEGGPHTEDNLICLCSSHHHLLHDGHLGLAHVGQGRVVFTTPRGQTEVVLVRPNSTSGLSSDAGPITPGHVAVAR